MVVNTIMISKRSLHNPDRKIFVHLSYASLIYLGLHYILNFFLGRWSLDFVNNQPDLTFVAASLRTMNLHLPHTAKLFEGSSLSTIALNLLILSWILYLLFRNNGMEKKTRNYLILGISGVVILSLSFLRIFLYSSFSEAIESKKFVLSLFYSFIFANPYPIITYLSYGFFGSLAGLMIYDGRRDLLKKIVLPAGLLFFVFGISGMMHFPKTISKPDWFWYFKTNVELGIFLLLIPGIYLGLENRKFIMNGFPLLKGFSRMCLTIYLLETSMSEILRHLVSPLFPEWDQTINGCLLFGCFNIIIWMVIIYFWRKVNFKYSLEYFWVKFFSLTGKDSTKLNDI
jgi:hypothetical protein